MTCNIKKSLLGCLDSVLGVRGDIGADLKSISIVTRTWSGKAPGDGVAHDETEEVHPVPGIRDHSHDIRLLQAGAVMQGDLILTSLSKNRYPTQDLIDCRVDERNIEKFYQVGEFLYRVIHVKERLVTWDVQVRRLSAQGDPG